MTTTMTANLDAIDARVRDCQTYNFGMRNADQLAHVDAPAMVAALRAVLDLHVFRPQETGGGDFAIVCAACHYDSADDETDPCPTVLAITTHLEGAS